MVLRRFLPNLPQFGTFSCLGFESGFFWNISPRFQVRVQRICCIHFDAYHMSESRYFQYNIFANIPCNLSTVHMSLAIASKLEVTTTILHYDITIAAMTKLYRQQRPHDNMTTCTYIYVTNTCMSVKKLQQV